MRFICDEMFGSLARWMRIIGQDTLYLRDVDDDEIIEVAAAEGRFLLTRDKELHRRYPYSLYINENDLDKQLSIVIDSLDLEIECERGRCTVCNGELQESKKADVEEDVPEFTFSNQERFYRCQDCKKVYWRGSHWENIRNGLNSMLNDR